MKKVLMMALTVLISVAFVTVVFAQAPAGTPEKKTTTTTTTTTPEKKETTTTTTETQRQRQRPAKKETQNNKSKAMMFRGEVMSMDAAAKTLDREGHERRYDLRRFKR